METNLPIYDITHPIRAELAVWPGDTPFQYAPVLRLRDGDSVNLGAVTMSAHTGTHADAPYHFDDSGAGMNAVDLTAYLGPALVADVRGKSVITCADLEDLNLEDAPRLLLRTGGWQETEIFPSSIPVVAPDVPDFLGERGVRLFGVDVPSVDELDSKTLPNHYRFAANGIAILESLRLADVPEGLYELIALPLPFVGADGSPVRAILRRP